MAYVTAGTYYEQEILQMELIILKVILLQECLYFVSVFFIINQWEDFNLNVFVLVLQALHWNLCPETAVSWMKLYFQMASMNSNSDLLESQFPQDAYVQMTRVGVFEWDSAF